MGVSRLAGYRDHVSTRDQIAVAQLWGCAQRCVSSKIPAAEAVASLREITTRADLLAQAAGLIAGSGHPDDPTYACHLGEARLLVQAGADRELLPRWIAEGRQNAAQSRPGLGVAPVWPDDLDEVLAEILDVDR